MKNRPVIKCCDVKISEERFLMQLFFRMGQARSAFRQLLVETKKITDKSLQLALDKV
jgi:hypothetical protein